MQARIDMTQELIGARCDGGSHFTGTAGARAEIQDIVGSEQCGRAAEPTAAPPRAATAAEVLALLRGRCRPLGAERVALDDALGRVLREPVCAPEDQPPFDRSSVDGYAVRADDPSRKFDLVDEIRAGDWKPRRILIGQCVRVATGAALPCDGLLVLMKEDAFWDGAAIRPAARAQDGCIRYRGTDARRGQVLVAPGTTIGAGTLALLASVGHTQPLVAALPRVLHAATGNEIVPPEEAPTQGRIRDSNSVLVRAFLKPWGIEPQQRRLPEEESVVRDALGVVVDGVDLLLVSGGASVGEHDFTRSLFEHLGYTVYVSKTNTRPGKPLIVAQRGASLALGLPGNPLAHFVCLNLYVRAALDAFAGRPQESVFSTGVLAAAIESDGNARETFWPALCRRQDGTASLIPLRWHNSGDITSLATANALIRVGGGAGSLPPGSSVEYLWTGRAA